MLKPSVTRFFKAGALAATLALAAVAAHAQPPMEPHGRGGPGDHLMMMHRELKAAGATDAQLAQIKAIFKQAMADEKGAHDALRTLHTQGQALFAQPVVDANAVMALNTQAQTQRDAIATRMARALIDSAAVLTPEQRAKIYAMQQKHEARMKEHMKDRADSHKANP